MVVKTRRDPITAIIEKCIRAAEIAGLPLTQRSDSGYISPIALASWLAEACGQFQDSFGSVSDGYVDELAARHS
jgi:hypothetical protein